jgi:5-formyltetrahydrofolate cyclo-ligase
LHSQAGSTGNRQGFRVPSFAGPSAAKAAVRGEVLAARRALTAAQRAHNAARVQAALRERIPDLLVSAAPGPPVAAAYVPTGTEPGGADLPDVLRGVLPPEASLLLPVLRDDLDLDWAVYDGTLAPARLGLREPVGPRLGVAAVADAALLVVPAVAADRRGVRLGRGGGSFDRALARAAPSARVVALLHDGELRGIDLPAEPHDRRVDAVITPAEGFVQVR